MIDRSLHCRVEKTLDRRIEHVQGDQHADFSIGDCHGSMLKSIEQGAFTLSKVEAGRSCLADRFKDSLQQLELVRSKRVRVNEIFGVFELLVGGPHFAKGKLILEDVAFL